MINSLKISNFRAFYAPDSKFHTLEFKPGINLITGDNGSGKTSIIKAIEASLFGYGNLERDEIINDRYYYECLQKGKKPHCNFVLILEDDNGKERVLIRAIRVGKSKRSTEILLDANLVEEEELEWRLLDKSSFDLINLVGIELGNHARQFKKYRQSIEALYMIPYVKKIIRSIRNISNQYEERSTITSEQTEGWISSREELLDDLRACRKITW